MEALETLTKLMSFTGGSQVKTGLDLADAATGGHLAEFLKSTQEDVAVAVEEDTRDAALKALDLARLNEVRIGVVLELLEELLGNQKGLSEAWEGSHHAPPEFAQVVAIASIVATGYTRQPSRVRKELLLDAMFGSLDPELFVWGQQDELLEGLMSARLGKRDVDALRALDSGLQGCVPEDARMEHWERLASEGFVAMQTMERAGGSGPAYIVHRTQLRGGVRSFGVTRTPKGDRLLQLLDAGKAIRRT